MQCACPVCVKVLALFHIVAEPLAEEVCENCKRVGVEAFLLTEPSREQVKEFLDIGKL